MERFRTMFQGFTYMDLGQFKKRLRSMAALGGAGSLCFYCIGLWAGDERFYKSMVMPLVRRVDPERAHIAAVWLAKHHLTPSYTQPDPDILRTSLWGLHFANPIGLAAGFDKDGQACDGMLRLGFGFVEVGSVTPLPQSGNERPRVFRLVEDNAIINRYGFNSEGHEAVGERLRKRLQESDSTLPSAACSTQAPSTSTLLPPVGVNLGKNKLTADAASDYVAGLKALADVAGYFVINVSSPNTPGLRDMQHGESLEQLLDRVLEARDALPEDKHRQRPPLLLKIAPDLTHAQKQHVAQCALKRKSRLAGLVVGNTTVSRPPSLLSQHRSEAGGLSGQPLKQLATSTVAEMYRLTNGEVPIVGVGGVASGQDAYDKIRAGASLVQLYTALTVDGPPTVSAIKRQLAELLRRDGFSNVSEAVGAGHRSASAE